MARGLTFKYWQRLSIDLAPSEFHPSYFAVLQHGYKYEIVVLFLGLKMCNTGSLA